MGKIIYRSISEAIRENLSWEEKWSSEDNGLIISWEVGRRKREEFPELAEKAKRNELPILNWKGGVEKELKIKKKYGALNYLAQWQGLRGEDLKISPDKEVVMTCSKTGVQVIFTPDILRYSQSIE